MLYTSEEFPAGDCQPPFINATHLQAKGTIVPWSEFSSINSMHSDDVGPDCARIPCLSQAFVFVEQEILDNNHSTFIFFKT